MRNDYSGVTPDQVREATDRAIAEADLLLDSIVAVDPAPTFEATLARLDQAFVRLDIGYGQGAFLARVHPDRGVRDIAQQAEERLSKWRVDVVFRDDLYAAVRAFAATSEAAALDGERRRLLEHWLRDFRRAGHELDAEPRAEIRRLQARLVELEVAYQRNIDEFDDGLELTRAELDGLPEGFVSRLRPGESPATYRVTMDSPEFFGFMDQARRRDLREQLEFKQFNRARDTNRPILEEALELRRRIAAILGYASWAAYATEEKMAGDPAAVRRMYDELVPALTRKARAELAEMERRLAADTGDGRLQTWDWRFYDSAIRREAYGVDQDEVAAHFPLERVLDGLVDLTADVFGLRYRRVEAALAWHPDVVLYEVADATTGEPLADIYLDLFPRPDKYTHAAAFALVPGHRRPDGRYERPVSAIVANVTKPAADEPSLLQHHEVTTLFHEFGHILHLSLTRAEFERFSGASTELDFVEAPSQIMEHWTWQPEVLHRFARHHRTGEPIPTELVERMIEARDVNVAVKMLRQCFLGLMDQGFHDEADARDTQAIYRDAYRVTGLPFHEGTYYPAGFGHLMGGYDAGYYGYLWSKVYGDDMFSRFEREGVTSPEVGAAYRREVLEAGGSRDGMEILRRFLGREPSNEAFIRLIGVDPPVPAATPDG